MSDSLSTYFVQNNQDIVSTQIEERHLQKRRKNLEKLI